MGLGPIELIIILVIVVILFGLGRVGKMGDELGTAIRQFREGLSGNATDEAKQIEPEQKG